MTGEPKIISHLNRGVGNEPMTCSNSPCSFRTSPSLEMEGTPGLKDGIADVASVGDRSLKHHWDQLFNRLETRSGRAGS